MESDSLVKLFVFILFLALSAFFSSAETAFTAINRLKLRNLIDHKVKGYRFLEKVLANPKKLITAILIGNNLTNIGASAMATAVLMGLLNQFGVLSLATQMTVITLSMTVLLLIIGEITPKTIAIKNPEKLALFVAKPVFYMLWLFNPVIFLFSKISLGVSLLFGIGTKEVTKIITQEEIQTVITMAKEEGLLEKEEHQMIHSIIQMSEKIVREIMTPRTDCYCIDVQDTVSEAIQIIQDKGHSRLPVFEETIDNIVGVLFAKDLLNVNDTKAEVRNFIREAIYVPETKEIEELLQQMKKSKFHIAVVMDEHGGMSGIVTMEDIIEEIVGDIQDEYDTDETPLYTKVSENNYIVDARINIDDLAELLDVTFPNEDDYDTLGGFILDELGKFPRKGEEFVYKNLKIKVTEISKRRILKLEISIITKTEIEPS